MFQRRGGAPRLIDWTGERAVPWAPDVNVVYEHYHRYLWAQTLVAGRRVLDVGSGEGYGSALLAVASRSVVGVDIDPRTVEHSRLSYANRKLSFEVASATDLSRYADASFDAVVAFEILEHVADHASLLSEIDRVLSEDGLVVISASERRAYIQAQRTENPFRVHELSEEEFRELLGEHFKNVCLFGQRTLNGSRIESLDEVDPAPSASFTLERHGDEWLPAGAMSPVFLIAVASRSTLPALAPDSTLSDFDLAMSRSAELASVNAQARAGELEEQLIAAVAHTSALDAELAAVVADRSRLESELNSATRDITSLELELASARNELAAACIDESSLNVAEAKVSAISAELAACRKAVGRPNDPRPLDQVIAELRKEADGFARIRASRPYAMITVCRRMLGRLAPPGTRRRAAYRLVSKGRRRS